jgi:hypothetical protein
VVDVAGQVGSDLARVFDLPAYEAGQKQRLGGLQLHRTGDEPAIRAEADRLAREGVVVFVLPEEEVLLPPVVVTGGAREADRLELRFEGGRITVSARELVLLVQGPIAREYQSRVVERKKPRLAGLDAGYRFHLYRHDVAPPLELDHENFSFGARGTVAGSSLLELKSWMADWGGAVAVDDGFKRLPPALAPAAAETGAGASLAAARAASARGKDAPLVLDNLTQFRFYSGWRAAVERRRRR